MLRRYLRVLSMVGLLGVVLLLALAGVIPNEVKAKVAIEVPSDPSRFLLMENFSGDTIGKAPAGWTINAASGYVVVVAEDELDSGRAVRIVSDPSRNNTGISAPLIHPPAGDARTIVIEHKVRHSRQKNNMYITKSNSHRLHWWVDNGQVYFNRRVGSAINSILIGPIQEGWNRIRIVADLHRQEAVFFINDMETPASDPLPFGREIDSWADARFHIAQSRGADREFYYGDIKVWSLDDEPKGVFQEEARLPIWLEYDNEALRDELWIEYGEVKAKPRGWWNSDEALGWGLRAIRRIKEGHGLNIGITIGNLAVPDGVLATQLLGMAHLYAIRTDDSDLKDALKEAFADGMNLLFEAQFASGGWPTEYPRYKAYDLHLDFYASQTWAEIPALFNEVLMASPPFDSGIASGVDHSKIEAALARIPAQATIKRFSYSDYAGYGADWWQSEEARRIGDNLISWQLPSGGWWRDEAWAVLPYSPGMMRSGSTSGGVEKGRPSRNGTFNPMRFLARVYEATGEEKYRTAFLSGLDYLLEAQYETGGWPNDYPNPTGIARYVMYNDHAMANAVFLLQDIASQDFPFGFVDERDLERVELAIDRAIDYILKTQIEVEGRLTGWGQQHHPETYEPMSFRSFEPVAISGSETVGVIDVLRKIPDPTDEVRWAILGALEWLEEVRLEDGRWARFYEIGTNRPIFMGRDSIVRYDISEIELERQLGYGWYGPWAASLLDEVRRTGYLDMLYESLPDYPSLRMRFQSPQPDQRVTGRIPVVLEFLQPGREAGLSRVIVDVNGEVVYSATRFPQGEELVLDTEQLEDGRHLVKVTVKHDELGTSEQSVAIQVANRWRLVQNMAPPVTEGWFGTIDYLQTRNRSAGWTYDTRDSASFYGDPHRLVRSTEESEYLEWETPRLKTVEITLFVRPGVDIKNGLDLAVAPKDNAWESLSYEATYETGLSDWVKVTVTMDFGIESGWNAFRLTLHESLNKDVIQIGDVRLIGFHPRQ